MDVDDLEREFGASWPARIRAFVQGPRLVRLVLVQRVVAYWRARALVNKTLFRATRRAFSVRAWARDTHSAASLIVQLGRTIAGQVFVAVAVIAIAVAAERLASRYTSFRLPVPASSGGSVRDVLNTIAQIAGIVLTLYYTALSVVISTAYANVATDLRTLIVREKSSYVYVKLLALTCAGSLILLAVDSFGVPIAGLPFLLILATTVLSVLSFVSLGLSAFRFFDPAVLAHQLADDFAVAVRSAASRSYVARQPSFQNYFRQQAAHALTTYGEIVATSSRPPHAQHLGVLSIRLAEVLRSYSLAKATIHPESLWFARTFKHPRWLMTSDSQIAMALNTGTTLQPTAVANTNWVEQLVAAHLLKALTLAMEQPSGKLFMRLRRLSAEVPLTSPARATLKVRSGCAGKPMRSSPVRHQNLFRPIGSCSGSPRMKSSASLRSNPCWGSAGLWRDSPTRQPFGTRWSGCMRRDT